MRKIAIFAFNGDIMCFAHGLFNALDMAAKGHEVRLIIEGSATGLIRDLTDEKNPFSSFYSQVRDLGLLEGICRACAQKMGTLEEAKAQGIPLLGEAYGHPAMVDYMEKGYEIITL
ncbi:MAG: cytoplasmic protein [delta proteobacterium ML8_F1]|nr:MAG: cytoplasmic protein [delta proteobacterium ML8_F1]